MRRMVSDKDIALLEDLESNNVNSQTISQIFIVNDIKAISGDILSKLKAGDIVLKNTNGQLHAYTASFKKDGEGICLTYTDASVVETQSYDYIDSAWVYNSEDKTNLVNYSAGDNVSIVDGVISATDTKYSAGTNISISDSNVISASGGTTLYLHNIKMQSVSNKFSATIQLYLPFDTPFTSKTTLCSWGSTNIANNMILASGSYVDSSSVYHSIERFQFNGGWYISFEFTNIETGATTTSTNINMGQYSDITISDVVINTNTLPTPTD